MTDPELKKRVRRFFFALDHFYENGLSEYWLNEMKTNRKKIEEMFATEEEEEADKRQIKLKLR